MHTPVINVHKQEKSIKPETPWIALRKYVITPNKNYSDSPPSTAPPAASHSPAASPANSAPTPSAAPSPASPRATSPSPAAARGESQSSRSSANCCCSCAGESPGAAAAPRPCPHSSARYSSAAADVSAWGRRPRHSSSVAWCVIPSLVTAVASLPPGASASVSRD